MSTTSTMLTWKKEENIDKVNNIISISSQHRRRQRNIGWQCKIDIDLFTMLFWYCMNIVYIAMLTMSRKKYALDINDDLLSQYLHLQICSLLWTYRVNKTFNSVWTFLCRHNDHSTLINCRFDHCKHKISISFTVMNDLSFLNEI